MKTFSEIKTAAMEQIKGKICILCFMLLTASILQTITEFIPFIGAIVSFVFTSVFLLGGCFVFIKCTKKEELSFSNIFYGFDDIWTAIKANFFVSLFSVLWYLLFFIPGIIKIHSYSQTFFILAENKGMPVLKAITLSRQMMDGHKMDLFLLNLSFIGWSLLCLITLGIASIWVLPYYYTTLANFYMAVKEDFLSKQTPPAITE